MQGERGADIVVNNLVGYAVTSGDVLIQSDGSPWRPLVHIEDITRAFLAVLHAPRELVHNEAFNVGRNDDNLRVREIAAMLGVTDSRVCQIHRATLRRLQRILSEADRVIPAPSELQESTAWQC